MFAGGRGGICEDNKDTNRDYPKFLVQETKIENCKN